jgi:hypothetical protein
MFSRLIPLIPLLALPLFAAQSLPYRHLALRQQTADSVTVVVSWTARNADSVRIAFGNGVTRTRGPRGRDSVRVARPTVATNFGVTLTPLRGDGSGAPRPLALALPVRPQPAPTIDSASVDTATTTAPVVTPPPITGPIASPTPFTPNLPAGLRLIGESDFDTPNAPNVEIINWDRNTVQSPTTHGVALMTVDGRSVVRAWFPEQHAGNGVGPMTITTGEINSRSHYMAVRLRYSANYEFHTNTEKLLYPVLTAPGAGAPLLNIGRNGELAGFSGPMNGPVAPLVTALSPAGVIPIGRWFHIEYYTRLNSPGQSDGEQRVWVDGRLVLDRRNVSFVVHGSQVLFLRGRLDFTRGGGPSSVLTPLGGQWVDVDRLAFYAGN